MLEPRFVVPSALLALALTMAPVRSADACSAPLCNGGAYLPAYGGFPANLPGFLFNPRLGVNSTIEDATVSLFRLENGAHVPVDITTTIVGGDLLVTPQAPFAENADYEVEGSDLCTSGLVKTSFKTGPTAPLPTSLGTLTAGEQKIDTLSVWTVSGSCTSPVTAAQIELTLAPSAEAAPWSQVLSLETLVDGQPWKRIVLEGESRWGSTEDLLYTTCASSDDGADEGLAEGQHSVTMRATIPGTSVTLESDPITVTLSCSPPVDDLDTGPDLDLPRGGCSMGAGSGGGVWAIAAIAAALAMGKRRSRRR